MQDNSASKAGRAAQLRRLFREDPAAFFEWIESSTPSRPEPHGSAARRAARSYPRLHNTARLD